MQALYTISELKAMPIAKLKGLAAERGIEPAPGTDKRVKDNWIDLLVEVTAGTVTAEEFATFSEPNTPEVTEANEIEALILSAIDSASAAEQEAILNNDQELARSHSETVDRLLEQYQGLIEFKIDNLAPSLAETSTQTETDIFWASPFTGCVSVDGGESYRTFRVIDAATDCPVVKVQTTAGIEIDSRWKTTAGNRYIKAVVEALPDRLEALATEMFTGRREVVATETHCSSEGTTGEGPIRGGNGNGDDRGRINNSYDAWPYAIDCGF